MLVETRFTISLSKRMCNSQGTCGCTPWVGQIKRRSNNIGIKLSLNKKTSITPSINQNRETCQKNFSDLDFKHISSNRGTQLDIRHFAKTSADITREEQDRKTRKSENFFFFLFPLFNVLPNFSPNLVKPTEFAH